MTLQAMAQRFSAFWAGVEGAGQQPLRLNDRRRHLHPDVPIFQIPPAKISQNFNYVIAPREPSTDASEFSRQSCAAKASFYPIGDIKICILHRGGGAFHPPRERFKARCKYATGCWAAKAGIYSAFVKEQWSTATKLYPDVAL